MCGVSWMGRDTLLGPEGSDTSLVGPFLGPVGGGFGFFGWLSFAWFALFGVGWGLVGLLFEI